MSKEFAATLDDAMGRTQVMISQLTALKDESGAFEMHRQNLFSGQTNYDQLSLQVGGSQATEERLNSLINTSQIDKIKLDGLVKQLSEFRGRWMKVESQKGDVIRRESQHSSASLGLTDMGNKSLDEIQNSVRQMHAQKSHFLQQREKKTQEENALKSQQTILGNSKREKEMNLQLAKQRGDRYQEVEAAMAASKDKFESLDSNQRRIQRELDDLNGQISDKSLALTRMKAELNQIEESTRNSSRLMQTDKESLLKNREQIQVQQRKMDDLRLNVDDIEHRIETHQSSIIELEETIKTLNPRISSLQAEIFQQERVKRTIDENIALRSNKRDKKKMEDSLASLQAKVGGDSTQIRDSQRELQRAEQDKSKVCSERDKLKGRVEAYLQQAVGIEQILQSTLYRDIDERYRRKTIEFETTEMAVKDLDTYFNAL